MSCWSPRSLARISKKIDFNRRGLCIYPTIDLGVHYVTIVNLIRLDDICYLIRNNNIFLILTIFLLIVAKQIKSFFHLANTICGRIISVHTTWIWSFKCRLNQWLLIVLSELVTMEGRIDIRLVFIRVLVSFRWGSNHFREIAEWNGFFCLTFTHFYYV